MAVAKPRPPSSGPGKQKKSFPEESGLSHLLSLSQSITDAKSATLDKRIEDKKRTVQLARLKKKEDADRKKEKSSVSVVGKAKSKGEIKKELKKQLREKTRVRRENRKRERAAVETPAVQEGKGEKRKVRKSVSFALA